MANFEITAALASEVQRIVGKVRQRSDEVEPLRCDKIASALNQVGRKLHRLTSEVATVRCAGLEKYVAHLRNKLTTYPTAGY